MHRIDRSGLVGVASPPGAQHFTAGAVLLTAFLAHTDDTSTAASVNTSTNTRVTQVRQ
jgi:hypothetical protein